MAEDEFLQEVVRRTLQVHPRATIILFGSRARGTARPDSDYDLAIVTPDLPTDRAPSARMRAALRGLRAGFDLLVLTPEQWQTMRTMVNSVVREAFEHGRVLHEGG